MQVEKYSFCDCNIEIRHSAPVTRKFNYGTFLASFDKPDFSFEVQAVDSLPVKNGTCLFNSELNSVYLDGDARKIYTAFWDNSEQRAKDYTCKIGDTLYASCPNDINEFFVFEGLRLPEVLLSKGIGLLHCSFIEVDGQAILFSGDKQVGKSTQAALWEKYGSATVINGDRAGLFVKNGKLYAGGVPYCGTSGICINKQMPVKAIICLSRGTENTLKKSSPMAGFMFLLGKFAYNIWDHEAVNAVSDLLTTVVEAVPIYSYSCVKDESAVKYLSERI